MSDVKHTALPWTLDDYGSVTFPGARKTQSLMLNGTSTMCSPGPSMDEAKANRDFMIRAANSHDALVAALKEVMEWVSNWDPNFADDPEWDETANRVFCALKLAEAEQ